MGQSILKGNLWYFEFSEELTDESQILCEECGEWSLAKDWINLEIQCDICGDHPGIMCPKCDEVYDHVWSDEFKARIKEK